MEVDEELIQSMIAGDIPSRRRNPEPAANPEPEQTGAGSETPEEAPAAAPKARRRKEPKSYGEVFLRKRVNEQRKHAYISEALMAKITRIVAVLGDGITVPTYIDNVLEHHLETYRDEIEELYSKETQKLW